MVSESTGWRLLSPGGAPTFAWSRTCSTAPRSRVDPGSCSWTVRPGSASPGWRGSSRSTSTGWRRGSSGTGAVACPTATGSRSGPWPRRCEPGSGSSRPTPAKRSTSGWKQGWSSSCPKRPIATGCDRGWPCCWVRAAGRRSRGRTCSRRGRRSSSISARRARWSCWWSTTPTMPTRACWTSWTTCWRPPRRRSSSWPWPVPSCWRDVRRWVGGVRAWCAWTRSTRSAMGNLVDGLVAGLPAGSRAALVDRAEGIPLFAVETVRALIDRDLVVPREGRYVPADGADLDLDVIGAPASLQALVAARLDALTTAERKVVTDASVLGASFTVEGLLALGPTVEDIESVLESLRRKEIVTVQTDRFSPERGQYRFVQSVVRQVAYATQSRRDRTARHLAAADHLAALPDPGDELRGGHRPAPARRRRRGCLGRAETHRPDCPGLRLPGEGCTQGAPGGRDGRVPGPARAGHRAHRGGQRPRAPAPVRRRRRRRRGALRRRPAPTPRPRSCSTTGWTTPSGRDVRLRPSSYSTLGSNAAAAVAIAEPRWRALDGVAGAERARFELARALRQAHAYLGESKTEIQYAGEMLILAEALDEPEAVATALGALGTGYLTLGAYRGGGILLESAAGISREHDLPFPLARALNNLAAFLNGRDLAAALRHAQECAEVARRAGLQGSVEGAMVNYAIGLWCAGRLVELAEIIPNGLRATQPGMAFTWWALDVWLADAAGTTPPPPLDEPTRTRRATWPGEPPVICPAPSPPATLPRWLGWPRWSWATRWPRPASTTTSSCCGPRWCWALSRSVISTSPNASSRPWPPHCPADARPPSPPSGTGCAACSPRPAVTTLRPSRQRCEPGSTPSPPSAPWDSTPRPRRSSLAGSSPSTARMRPSRCWRPPARRTRDRRHRLAHQARRVADQPGADRLDTPAGDDPLIRVTRREPPRPLRAEARVSRRSGGRGRMAMRC